jgi:hypothetical protein
MLRSVLTVQTQHTAPDTDIRYIWYYNKFCVVRCPVIIELFWSRMYKCILHCPYLGPHENENSWKIHICTHKETKIL